MIRPYDYTTVFRIFEEYHTATDIAQWTSKECEEMSDQGWRLVSTHVLRKDNLHLVFRRRSKPERNRR